MLGAIAVLVPASAALMVGLDPVRRRGRNVSTFPFVKVATLEAVPRDGTPRKFAVVADKIDAWNRVPNVPIGAVYLRRVEERKVVAIQVLCPHAGCFVDYQPEKKSFLCPCHNSLFGVDGSIQSADSPSPRGLDVLEVELRNRNEVWVKFQNFEAGRKEKVAVV